MLLKDLGNRIRARREKRGLKQHDVANALDISPQAVSKWERGENGPDLTVLEPLARLLGVTVDWLIAGSEEPKDVFEATVFVSSIHGAHEKALQMRPRDFALWANGVFYQITEIALRHEGVPIKYMGDQFLCFFSGARQQDRALRTAFQARTVVADNLKIGISQGEIYLGSVGHPDYARPDIMGEVVNIAFLTQEWADKKAGTGIAATQAVLDEIDSSHESMLRIVKQEEVRFRGVQERVRVNEIQPAF